MSGEVTTLSVILGALAPLPGRLVLDLGCGAGRLARHLAEAGAGWVGVDPDPPPRPKAPVIRAAAEALPFAGGVFDGAVCLNALHHVPVSALPNALDETARVLRPGAPFVVIEPLADGPLSRVLAVIDDEAEIRAAAQTALDAAVSAGRLWQEEALDYDRTESWPDFETFLAGLLDVDGGRAAAAAEHEAALRRAFADLSAPGGKGRALEQPMRARILAAPDPARAARSDPLP